MPFESRAEREPEVLVVGAGPVGLTVANLLTRQGVRCRVVDAGDGPVRESRATDVHARTLELLATVGLADALVARGRTAKAANFYGSGRRVTCVRLDQLATPYPFALGVPQYETERLLLDALADAKGPPVERGVTLTGLTQQGASVHVTLSHREGREETVTVPWVVGCDGSRSAVRRALGIAFEGETYPESFLLADVRVQWALPDDELHIFLSERGFFQALPMPGARRCRLFLDLADEPSPDEFDATGAPTPALFARLAKERVALPIAFDDFGWRSRFRIHKRLAARYRDRRVFLAGDAAHVHSPVGGQGMNTGIQDAFNLAWKLSLAVRGRGSEALLDSYDEERRAVGRLVLRETHFATRMSMLRSPLLCAVRDATSAWMSSATPFQRWLAEVTGELRVHHAGSTIVAEDRAPLLFAKVLRDASTEDASVADWIEFGGAPGAGARAPDRLFGLADERRRFFSMLDGTRHLVLLFDGASATEGGYKTLDAIAARVRARFGALVNVRVVVPSPTRPAVLGEASVVLDPGGDLHCGFGARAECVYVLRPDGYVGYRAQPADADALDAYLTAVLGAPPDAAR